MNNSVELWEKPLAEEIYLIAGWRQWADAGSISSGLPNYLINRLAAKRIGIIKSDGFYLFQLPSFHQVLRPVVKFEDGYSKSIRPITNDFYYIGNQQKGLVIFLGEEPNMDIDRYADAFFYAIKQLGVKRTAIVGGVYGAMPYDKDREVSCSYSQRYLKQELSKYAVRFSNYEGGATIGSYFVDRAEQAQLEIFVFNAFVPSYDLSHSHSALQRLQIEDDYKAWHELMVRIDYMFGLGIDLSDLDKQSELLVASIDAKLDELEVNLPQLQIRKYLQQLTSGFTENPFLPLDELWERELGDLFKDEE